MTGRNNLALGGVLLISFFLIVDGFLYHPVLGVLNVALWVFAAPSAVYLIDSRGRSRKLFRK